MHHSVCPNLETIKAVCSSYYFQDNMLCINISGAPSRWKAGLVLSLGNVSVEESLAANWSTFLTFSSLRKG